MEQRDYPGFTLAGNKHPRIKQVEHLLNNTKPNPRGLAVIEGLWALGLAARYNLPVESFILCPELIHSIEAQEMAKTYQQRAVESCLGICQGLCQNQRASPRGRAAGCSANA